MNKVVVVAMLLAMLTGCVAPNPEISEGDNYSYAIANRYSNCIKRHSEVGTLTYDEMKEVCSVYLK